MDANEERSGHFDVKIRPDDEDTLKLLAEKNWREPAQQAAALLEQALRRERHDPATPRTKRARAA